MKKQESFKKQFEGLQTWHKILMGYILISPRLLAKIVSQTIPTTSTKKQGFLGCKLAIF
jgi:hypothetical protein